VAVPQSKRRPSLPRTTADVLLIFDGGALGNPGQGYGSYVYGGLVAALEPIQVTYPGVTTNNQAEYQTLIKGLRAVLEALGQAGRQPATTALDVRSDSKLVVEQVNGRWKVREAGLQPHVREAQTLLGRFGTWQLSWHARSVSVRILGH